MYAYLVYHTDQWQSHDSKRLLCGFTTPEQAKQYAEQVKNKYYVIVVEKLELNGYDKGIVILTLESD